MPLVYVVESYMIFMFGTHHSHIENQYGLVIRFNLIFL